MKSIKYEYKVKQLGSPGLYFKAGFHIANKNGKAWREKNHVMCALTNQIADKIYRYGRYHDKAKEAIREFFKDKKVCEFYWGGEGYYGCNEWSIETFVEKSSSKYKDVILEALRSPK